jgi:hypothetical protein
MAERLLIIAVTLVASTVGAAARLIWLSGPGHSHTPTPANPTELRSRLPPCPVRHSLHPRLKS